MPDAPLVSVKFHAYLSGSTACSVGNVLIKDSASNDYYVIATTANRGTRRSEGVAITAYGGSSVGSVQLQQTGTLPQEITGLSTGFGSKQLVRVSATGTLERIATGSVNTSTDDIIGYAEENGRVHLYPGWPFAELVALLGGSSITLGGSNGDVVIKASASSTTGVTGSNGDVLYKTGGVWGSTPALQVPSGSVNDPVGLDGTGGLKVISISGGTPGGSDNQIQYNNGGAFGGTSGLTYDEGTNRPDMPNGWRVTSGGQTATFAVTPTGARTITFQDATHTVVGRDTTDTLTNKTINATNNTITDTSTAQYDILESNGTKFVRKAKGSNSTLLGISAAGALVYAAATIAQGGTGLTAVPGNSGELIYNNGGAYAATTNVTFAATRIRIGANPTNTTGLGLNNNAGITFRNAANSLDITAFNVDGSNVVRVGDSNSANMVLTYASTAGFFSSADGVYDFLVSAGADISCRLPLKGNQGNSKAFRLKSTSITQNSTANKTLVASEYENPILLFSGTPGGAFNVIGPNLVESTFIVWNGTSSSMTFGISAGVGVTIGSSASALVFHNGTDYKSV